MKISIFKNTFLWSVVLAVALQLILAFQGIDVCDDGFMLTFYQQFFHHPESVEYNFMYWLAGFLGGLWYEVFNGAGLLSFKILAIIVNTLTYIVSYKVLAPFVNKKYIIIGLLMALFINDFGFLVFYHNQLTALLTVSSLFILFKGLHYQRAIWVVMAGTIIGVNIFARLTNLSLLSLVILMPFYGIITGKSFKEQMKLVMTYFSGICIGVILIILLLIVLDQWHIFLNALQTITDLGKASDSSHNFSDLISIQLLNYRTILGSVFKFGITIALLLLISQLIKHRLLRNCLLFVLGIVLFGFWIYNQHTIYAVYVLSLIGSIIVMLRKGNSFLFRSIGLASLLILIVLPLGSAGGVISSGYMCIWLSLPLFFHTIAVLSKLKLSTFEIRFQTNTKSIVIVSLALAFFGIKAYRMFNEAYFDPGSRLEKTAEVNSKFLKHVYTTKERAIILNDLLLQLNNITKPNDYLLMYDNMPLIHYVTETKPYMYNPWVWLYDDALFMKKLNEATQNIEGLPVVVAQKFNTILKFSPPTTDYLSSSLKKNNDNRKTKNGILNNFLTTYNYEIVWSNSYFNIYKANTPKN